MSAGGAIATAGLRKSYGHVEAVRGVDIAIDAGETVALLGPNGAGKSTTIDMILGLSRPDGGTVSVFGGLPTAAVDAGQVGAMLQTGDLIRDLTVGELVAMVASLYPAPLPVAEALQLTGIEEIAGQRTQKLSGGQTQRVRFAIALVSDAKLLVLDEPTVAMDVEGRRSFWTTMRELAARGKTIVFATHYLEEADAYADRAILMAHGLVVADGPPTEIKAMVGTRTIRATLPGAALHALAALPGVSGADRRGESVVLSCADSDAAIRALLNAYPGARDIEIAAAGLEEAFLQLTAEEADIRGSSGGATAAEGASASGGNAASGSAGAAAAFGGGQR
ncbi:MAG TPA: ABC transporter ATP-binding protein [Solirubrobacteraceae bacterium]|jgi:ABC-2 type transport system ATP-binding protein|nr:ABC transporter ATP-binding protein [Solirubrobacteraceae bacterium]